MFLRHGARYIKAHICRVQLVSESNSNQEKESECNSDEPETIKNQAQQNEISVNDEADSDDETTSVSLGNPQSETDHDSTQVSARSEQLIIKANDAISFKRDDGLNQSYTVLGRAGKRTGKYRNWYNVRDSEGNVSAVDLTNVSDLKVTSETDSSDVNDTNDEVLQLQHDEFDTAKQQELQSWKDHNVYESVPFEKQRCISVHWVCSLKTTESGIKPKARLVARGFEEQSDSIEKESPTCSKDAMRTMLSLINKNGWKLSSLDIKTAFLQGEKIDRDVYLRPPKEAKCDPGIVWKLHKCVYGLPDASLKWYEKVRKSMEGLNGKMSVLDNALFMWHKNGVLIGMIAVHVDDFLCAGNDIFLKKVKPCLGDTFSVGKEEATGLHLDQTENSLSIHQK